MQLLGNQFEYIGYGRIDEFLREWNGLLPAGPTDDEMGWVRSRIVHKLFNTFGRGMLFRPHIAIGAAFKAGT